MDKQQIAHDVLGYPGRMISGSKSGYSSQHPDNVVVFNANVCVEKVKIWHGDLDITKDIGMLTELAKKINEPIYVLREMDGRFENDKSPLIEKHVAKIMPDGSRSLGEEYLKFYSKKSI